MRPTATSGSTPARRVVTVPLWALVVLAALLPAVRLPPYARTRSRTRRGVCPRCAYDLTGNVSGVCPECGSSAARK